MQNYDGGAQSHSSHVAQPASCLTQSLSNSGATDALMTFVEAVRSATERSHGIEVDERAWSSLAQKLIEQAVAGSPGARLMEWSVT